MSEADRRQTARACAAAVAVALAVASLLPSRHAAAQPAGDARIEGRLLLGNPRDVPAGAIFVVQARADEDGAVLAETRGPVEAGTVAVAFGLAVPAASRGADQRHVTLRAVVLSNSWRAHVGSPFRVPLPGANAVSDVGGVPLHPRAALRMAYPLKCGDEILEIGTGWDNGPALRAGERLASLRKTRAATGFLYETLDAPLIQLAATAEAAVLSRPGHPDVTCRPETPMAGSIPEMPNVHRYEAPNDGVRLEARGHKPSWHLLVRRGELAWRTSAGTGFFVAPSPEPEALPSGGQRFVTETGGRRLVATSVPEPCADLMSGMPFATRVTVEVDGFVARGCGGTVLAALSGSWQVTAIDGRGLLPGPAPDVFVYASGRFVSGHGSCSAYNADLTLTAEALRTGPLNVRPRSCAPGLADQERRFFDALAAVERASIDPETRALTLHGRNGRTITARRD